MNIAIAHESTESSTPDISMLLDLVAEDMEAVNRLILSMVGSNVDMIPEIASHLISSGGKRLRPMLTLASAKMHGYGGDGHIELAASVEFMHTATLLHDDVVDESDVRRGKLAAHKLWGNQASVLVGDYLLGQAFKKMVGVGSLDALDIMATASAVIAEGEVMQLSTVRNMATDENRYLKVISAKTAALFSASMEVGPVIAGAGKEERNACREFGHNLGMAFQLVDDALDYGGSSEVLGKNVGDDFREGKITLPVIYAYQAGDSNEKEFWQKCMGAESTTESDLTEAMELLKKHGGVAKTVKKAVEYGDRAKNACSSMRAGTYADIFRCVADFCISRVN